MSKAIIRDALRTATNPIAGPSRLAISKRLPIICPIHHHHHHHQRQLYSSMINTNSPNTTLIQKPQPHQHPAFENLSNELSSTQPCFGSRGDEVELLTSPQNFYNKLLEMIKRAKRRILISSLYIGTEEGEMVDAIRHALSTNSQLRVVFMLDYHRSTRLSRNSSETSLPPSTAHLLLPLVEAFPDRCEVWLYRSPKLRGLLEKIVPERYDEGWGTWHGKWYGVDDEVLISGANLASSYFTNRQDRYIHFRSNPSLLSYLSSLTRLFTQYSYLLHHSPPAHISPTYTIPLPNPSSSSGGSISKGSLIWPSASINPRKFQLHALATLTAFQNSWKLSNSNRSRRIDIDTWFWPVIQSGVLGLKEEEKSLNKVWSAVKNGFESDEENGRMDINLTSGYFGLYKEYKNQLIKSPANVKVIAASPKANGFYGSKGFSRLIPEGYTLLESRFHREAVRQGREWNEEKGTGVRLREWEKEGWTYHSKGIWLSPSSPSSPSSPNPSSTSPTSSQNPFLTFIGSSNLSTRSLNLDTELSLILMTSSPSLRKALGQEIKTIDKNAKDVGEETWNREDRKVSLLARILVALGVEGML